MAAKRTLGYRRVVLFRREGAGMVSSWEDVIELTRRKNGRFTLRLRVVPFCTEDGPAGVAYRSRPFRTAEALLAALQKAARSRCLDLYDHDIEAAVEAVAPLDGGLCAKARRLLAPEAPPEHPRCAEWRARHPPSLDEGDTGTTCGRVIDLATLRPGSWQPVGLGGRWTAPSRRKLSRAGRRCTGGTPHAAGRTRSPDVPAGEGQRDHLSPPGVEQD